MKSSDSGSVSVFAELARAMQARASLAELVRGYYRAYESRDRAAIEGLLAADFTFTSPRADHIDRGEYLARCWPECERIEAIRIERLFEEGEEALVLCRLTPLEGAPFHNVEHFVRQGRQIRQVVAYFGRGGAAGLD